MRTLKETLESVTYEGADMKLKRLGICILTATLAFVLVGCSGLSGSKHPAGLVGTYELDSMDIKSGDKTQSITKEQYEQVSKAGNFHITLELSEDGTAILNSIEASGQPEKLDLKWESSDGKSITLSEDSSKEKITASVDDKQITLEQSSDKASVKMVFSKVSDKPGYYSDSSKK